MALSAFSKQCIVIVALLFMVCLTFIIDGFIRSSTKSESTGLDHFLMLIGAAAISCLLMITGIVKRNLLLMVPWILCALAVLWFAFMELTLFVSFGALDSLRCPYILIPGAIYVILNPFFAVFYEIHHERSVKREQHGRV